MIHSGSRAIGQAVRGHHLTHATKVAGGLLALDTDTPAGQAYRHDQQWACEFAAANRQAIAMQIIDFMRTQYSIRHDDSLTISCDHNHVRREQHFGESWLVHRKGAMPADDGLPGVIPGSMGTLSYHVTGRGHPQSLRSSAHGAGRLLSRRAARQRFTKRDLVRELSRVWFDPRLADALREEAPKSYKDIRAVMRAQAELVDIARMLKPLLVYKGAA
jgi:tRNA-splicing ligase RtcB